jgi:hypothetical protein
MLCPCLFRCLRYFPFPLFVRSCFQSHFVYVAVRFILRVYVMIWMAGLLSVCFWLVRGVLMANLVSVLSSSQLSVEYWGLDGYYACLVF